VAVKAQAELLLVVLVPLDAVPKRREEVQWDLVER
jgi:hypothetical protein